MNIICGHERGTKHVEHKIISIRSLNTDIIPESPPKLECIHTTKIIYTPDDEYRKIRDTQDTIVAILFEENIDVSKICEKIYDLISQHKIDIDETYTMLASYSMWECIEYFAKHIGFDNVKQNGHKFNILHKALLPVWLWNYKNPIIELPIHLKRTPDDVYKTVNYIVSGAHTPSVLEPTPRVPLRADSAPETSIILVTNTIPRQCIEPIFAKLYSVLVCRTDDIVVSKDCEYVFTKLFGTVANDDTLSTIIKWLIVRSPMITTKKFFEHYGTNDIVQNATKFFKILCGKYNTSAAFNNFFMQTPFTNEHITCTIKLFIDWIVLSEHTKFVKNTIISILNVINTTENLHIDKKIFVDQS